LKQQTGLNYLSNFEMAHLKRSLTSQCYKARILHIVFKTKKANWPGIVQQPVNAGSRVVAVKTAKPSVDYRPRKVYSR